MRVRLVEVEAIVLAFLALGLTLQGAQQPTFSVQVELVTTDVVPRDSSGNFVADLTRNDFEVYEDDVRQQIASITLSHGGRATNVLAPPAAQAPEGIILPQARRVDDTSGRIIVFFIDDLHLIFERAPRVRDLLRKAARTLIHEGDLFGVVSSGTSSISVQLTYDRKRFDEIVNKVMGEELTPDEIINGISGASGPSEVRYRARVAMDTVNALLSNLEKVHDRRKALVYVSDGYDFAPFQDSRLGLLTAGRNTIYLQNYNYLVQQQDDSGNQPTSVFPDQTNLNIPSNTYTTADPNPTGSAQKTRETFADVELAIELAELTRTANRANTTIYTIDPRGLVGPPDIDQAIDPRQWTQFIQKSQNTLREIADETGGFAIVNQNDFDAGLKRIDAEAGDYYVLGYYSSNPNPSRRVRRIEVRVTRPGVEVISRKEYIVRSVATPLPPSKP